MFWTKKMFYWEEVTHLAPTLNAYEWSKVIHTFQVVFYLLSSFLSYIYFFYRPFYAVVCLSIILMSMYLSFFCLSVRIIFCYISSECRPGYKKATKDDDHLATHDIIKTLQKYRKIILQENFNNNLCKTDLTIKRRLLCQTTS